MLASGLVTKRFDAAVVFAVIDTNLCTSWPLCSLKSLPDAAHSPNHRHYDCWLPEAMEANIVLISESAATRSS